MGAAGIICNHAAQGAIFFRGWVDGKEELMGFEELIERFENDSWLYLDPLLFSVKFQDLVHVFRKIEKEPFSHFVACAAGASSPWRDGDVVLRRKFYDVDNICLVSGCDDTQGPHAV
jgi:hypothetical protein